MERITLSEYDEDGEPVYLENDYYSVEGEDGVLRCSCGAELVKLDDKTYQCPGGYPIYRFDEGEVVLDKFGNLLFKHKSHEPTKANGEVK